MAGMHKWTVVYLMDCPGNTTKAAKAMFDDILSLTIPDEISISICLHIPVAAIKKVDPLFPGPATNNSPGQTTLFYRVVRKEGGGSKLDLLNEDKKFDITSQQDIRSFFQSIQDGEQKAENYMLFTWGHGAAISVFVSGTMMTESPKMLDMVELKGAILDTFSGRLKLIVMVDCFMQYFDTGLLLHQANVEYLVAAQYGITFFGYNYRKIFGALYATPAMSSKELATLIIPTRPLSKEMKDRLACAAFFATKLSSFDDLVNIINKLGEQLSIEMDERPHLIHSAIRSDNYLNGAGKLMDLFVAIYDIADALGDDWQAETIAQLKALQKEMFIAAFTGPEISKPNPVIARGLSVSIPKSTDNHFYNTFVTGNPGSISGIAGTCKKWTAFVDKYVEFADGLKIQTLFTA